VASDCPDYQGRVVRRRGEWRCVSASEWFRSEFFASDNLETSADQKVWAAAWISKAGATPVPIPSTFITREDITSVFSLLKRLHATTDEFFAKALTKAFPNDRDEHYRKEKTAAFVAGGGAFGMCVGRGDQMRRICLEAAGIAEVYNQTLQAAVCVFVWGANQWSSYHAKALLESVPSGDHGIVNAIYKHHSNSGDRLFHHFLLMSDVCQTAWVNWYNTK
jgi:hypothetical protein